MAIDEQTILTRLFSLTETIGHTEASLATTTKSLDNVSKKLDDVVVNQEKLLQLQLAQQQEIKKIDEEIENKYLTNRSKAKELFQKSDILEGRVSNLEGQMKAMQEQQKLSSEEKREKIKGKWAFYAATIAAAISGITAIIIALLK